MSWRIIEHTDDHICVEFDDGHCVNYNVQSLIEPRLVGGDMAFTNNGVHIAGIPYRFDANAILPTHTHDTMESLHNIECTHGRVMVRREQSGDVTLRAGEMATIALGEKHSVEALEPSKTVHWRVQ